MLILSCGGGSGGGCTADEEKETVMGDLLMGSGVSGRAMGNKSLESKT